MLPVADKENFYYFQRLGDETIFPQKYLVEQFPGSGPFYSGLLETADLTDEDFTSAGISRDLFSNYFLAGEVPGACRFWVDYNDTDLLNSGLNWDRT